MKPATTSAQVDRLIALANLLSKYGHRWGENPSARMIAWVDEFTELREVPEAWAAACAQKGWSPDSTAYDCLA